MKQLEKALLIVGVGGVLNYVYSVFLVSIFNIDPAITISTMICAYTIISGYMLILGIKYRSRKIYSVKETGVLILIGLAVIFIAAWIAFTGTSKGQEEIGLAKSLSVVFGLIAGFLSVYVFSKN